MCVKCWVCVCFISIALVHVCCSFSPTAPARSAHTLQITALVSFSRSHCSKKTSKIVSGLQLKSLTGHLYVSNGVITEVALQPAANR